MKAFFKLIGMLVIFAVGYITGVLWLARQFEKADEYIAENYDDEPEPSTEVRQQNMTSAETTSEATVFITERGTKYHREDCQWLEESRIETSLESAREKYAPCMVCKPLA